MSEYPRPTESQDPYTPDEPLSEFGLVDVVEAFTALRHELRGQIKESRTLGDTVNAASTNIRELEGKLMAQTASGSTDVAKKLAEVLADTDTQLTRAIAAVAQAEATRRQQVDTELQAIQRFHQQMNPLARALSRSLLNFIAEQSGTETRSSGNDAAIDGLTFVLTKLRRAMKEHQLERVETVGEPFNGETMKAIGTVPSTEYPSGHVADQLSAAYRWRGALLRFADVRVSA